MILYEVISQKSANIYIYIYIYGVDMHTSREQWWRDISSGQMLTYAKDIPIPNSQKGNVM